MSSLSIVVPRLGPDVQFENTLASILRYRMPHHQVIVVQSDLQADTYGLQDEVEFVEVPGGAGRSRLVRYYNRMLKVARGETVNIIRPGVEVTHQWFAHGIRHLRAPQTGCVASILVAGENRDEFVSCGITAGRNMLPRHLRETRQRPLGPDSWAGFYRNQVLQAIGEVDESLSDDFLGLDLALSIRRLGLKCDVVKDRVLSIACPDLLKLRGDQRTGCDAQRMIQRHLRRDEQTLGSAVAFGSDLLTSFWRPARWPQLAGRWAARKKQATDRAFSRRLDLVRHDLDEFAPEFARRKAA